MKERRTSEIYIPKEYKVFEAGSSLLINTPIDGQITMETLLWIARHENNDKAEKMKVYLNCPGGDAFGVMAISDAMRQCTKPVHTVGIGKVYSGAALLLASGDGGHRSVFPNADVMIHDLQITTDFYGSTDELKKFNKDMRRTNKRWLNALSDMTGNSYSKIKKDCKGSKYFNAVEAVEYGLADYVEPISKKRIYV